MSGVLLMRDSRIQRDWPEVGVTAGGLSPGAAGLHLVGGLPLLRPGEQAFEAMLDGWRNQQLARRSVRSRCRSIRPRPSRVVIMSAMDWAVTKELRASCAADRSGWRSCAVSAVSCSAVSPVGWTRSSRCDRMASGSLLITEVEVQAAACADRVDQGLQLRRRGRLGPCLPPAPQRGPGGKPGADRPDRPRPGRRRGRRGGWPPSLRGRAPAAVPARGGVAGDRRTRRPSRS